MSTVQPLPQTAMTAARLREMARELLMQAAALDAMTPTTPRRKGVTLIDPRKKQERKG